MVAIALIATIVSNAQLQVFERAKPIEIGKIKSGMYLHSSLSYVIQNDKDTTYTLAYRNGKYQILDSYETLYFNSENNTLNTLYEVMHKAFKVENIKDYSVDIQLGNQLINIIGYKQMGVKGVMVITSKGWINVLTENQLNKLFGK